MGLLHPPIVLEEGPGTFLVINGNSRIQILRNNSANKQSVLCHVLSQKTAPKRILEYLLEEQLQSGLLSPMEKACFFSLCMPYMNTTSIAQFFLPLLCEKVQEHTVKKYLSFLRLDTRLQRSVHRGVISEKIATELITLKSDDRTILHDIILEVAIGSGKQKRLLSLCRDLAGKEETTIHELLSRDDYQSILRHKEMNPPQKGALLLSSLQKHNFPESMAAEREFLQKIKALDLPSSCYTSHSQAFETDEILLIVRFPSLKDLEDKLQLIQDLHRS
jgi:ParB family chromosome partitioning protein